jgi:hypothetical protein
MGLLFVEKFCPFRVLISSGMFQEAPTGLGLPNMVAALQHPFAVSSHCLLSSQPMAKVSLCSCLQPAPPTLCSSEVRIGLILTQSNESILLRGSQDAPSLRLGTSRHNQPDT